MNDTGRGEPQDERAWAADKRDFVADRRDDVAQDRDMAADDRDTTADARDRLADEREGVLDQREEHLNGHGAARGLPSGRPVRQTVGEAEQSRTERADAGALRGLASAERARRRAARESATELRDESAKPRQAGAGSTGLAMAFAEIARHLYEAENFEDVLERIVDVAVATVTGCDMASVTVRQAGSYRTVSSTDAEASEVDLAQYEANEGPCLDAIDEAVVHVTSLPDERWPVLASRPLQHGVQAVASYRLTAPGRVLAGAVTGSLNTYARAPGAFDDEALEIGLVLAAHASTAVRAAREREGLELFGSQLHEALSSRDVIGQAKGILMERLKLTPEDAFDFLRRSSQHLNLKLREVAQRLAETGEVGEGPPGRHEVP